MDESFTEQKASPLGVWLLRAGMHVSEKKLKDWRETKMVRGWVPSLDIMGTKVATDGLLILMVRDDNGCVDPFHLNNFQEIVTHKCSPYGDVLDQKVEEAKAVQKLKSKGELVNEYVNF